MSIGFGEDEATQVFVGSRKPFAAPWEYLLEQPIMTVPAVNNWTGSALLDEDGKLIGVGSLMVRDAMADRPGVAGNLFVPVNLLKPILADMLADGKRSGTAPAWLGMVVEARGAQLVVASVFGGGPADRAGVAPGDVVIGVAGQKAATNVELFRQIARAGGAGSEIAVSVAREGKVRVAKVRAIDSNEYLVRARGI
jgi:S1-C subfamily serine protease